MDNPTPRGRRKERARQAILQAALELILEKGPDNLSLRELARRSDYSPAGLYEHFESKDAIVEAVATEGLAHLRAHLGNVPSDLPSRRRLIELGMAYVEFARQNPEQFAMIFSPAAAGAGLSGEITGDNSPYRVFSRAAGAALATGKLTGQKDYGPQEIGYGLWALAHGIATLQTTHLRYSQIDFSAADRYTFEAYLRGLRPKS
jgi:AcrR family transcriptional regulator